MSNYSELLKDPRWQKKRLEVLDRDQWFCQACRDSESTLHVHHIRYTSKFPWETPNHLLVTLCESCHSKEEALRDYDFYDLIADTGLTRKDLIILLEHVKYRMLNPNEPSTPFWIFNDEVLSRLIERDELSRYATFLCNGGREVING